MELDRDGIVLVDGETGGPIVADQAAADEVRSALPADRGCPRHLPGQTTG